VILAFPLKGDFERAAHLADAAHPMLFLQGTDDALGDVEEIKRMVGAIGTDTSLHFVESAGQGFSVPDRSDEDVYAELARTIANWTAALA
jgi:predicted alpha/beta-hydrolase family hydrolase